MTKLNRVTLYRIGVLKAPIQCSSRPYFSFEPAYDADEYESCTTDDGGKLYALPEGYCAAKNQWGEMMIWDAAGACEIEMHPSGRPQIIGLHSMPVLREVAIVP